VSPDIDCTPSRCTSSGNQHGNGVLARGSAQHRATFKSAIEEKLPYTVSLPVRPTVADLHM